MHFLKRYMRWLHTQWPAGTVEKLPEVGPGGITNLHGVRVVGDLSGIPLLKMASDGGARAIREIVAEPDFAASKGTQTDIYDVAIVGGGVAGIAAAIEAQRQGLNYILFETTQPFSTIANFPTGKPIYTYPLEMQPAGTLQFSAEANIKEKLLDDLQSMLQQQQITITSARIEYLQRKSKYIELHHADTKQTTKALRAIVAIGRSGNFRKLNCPGESLNKVFNRLHDPKEYTGKNVLVVGGGDTALETAIALAAAGAKVTLSYRGESLNRAKPENIEKILLLLENPQVAVAVEQPSSERVTTATMIYDARIKNPGSLKLELNSQVKSIQADRITLQTSNGLVELPNDAVFSMIGREAPLEFFRRSGISIRGEWRTKTWIGFVAFFAFAITLYHWKSHGPVKAWFKTHELFPYNISPLVQSAFPGTLDPSTLAGTLLLTAHDPAFYYSLAYTLCIVAFGLRRIRRRQTPYVKRQTVALASIQIVPLFLLPFILLPWLGHNGYFGKRKQVELLSSAACARLMEYRPDKTEYRSYLPAGLYFWTDPEVTAFTGATMSLRDRSTTFRTCEIELNTGIAQILDEGESSSWLADRLFPIASYDANGREYWRASGFILAWPLFVWNIFTGQPLWLWLAISLLQTFVLIPLLIYRFGKGAYCGWVCSCGALAETMGDAHRSKMPHGAFWNRFNMLGQIFLASAFLLLFLRILGWIFPGSVFASVFNALFTDLKVFNYFYIVDLWWAGIIGVGMYFHFSGRVWCRFACPLAALMHIYARFSRFRIFPEKKKCISCNVCTSVCHQGIDIMNFANKGLPMQDPQCVRCSACVNECPTGVLKFGYLDTNGQPVLERLPASKLHS